MSQTISQQTSLPSQARPGALSALLRGAALARLADIGWIRISGDDRVRWLNGMVTNAVAALAEGEGCYNFLLNAQGQIQGDGTVFLRSDDLLLETGGDQVPAILEMLDRFIIMDDVELTDISAGWEGLLLAGPDAPGVLSSVLPDLPQTKGLSLAGANWRGAALTVVHAHSPLLPRFELWAEPATIAALEQALVAAALPLATAGDLETLRILEGTPRFGADIRGRELPQETAQARALHFNKGCYLGQEIVERIRSRGKLHRTFTGFLVEDEGVAPGTEVLADGQAVGVITSIADLSSAPGLVPAQFRPALGYARRDALEAGRELAAGGGRVFSATVPFSLDAPAGRRTTPSPAASNVSETSHA